jgi:xanthine dehydrogenase accessory factor
MNDVAAIGGQRAVIERARGLRDAGRAFALMMVVRADGSTYRKPGALALVAADGSRVGVISGGCLEPGVDALAREALAAGQPRVTVFDTRDDDDLLFGSGSGCRGHMQVLALPWQPGIGSAAIDAIIAAFVEGRRIALPLATIAPALFSDGEVDLRPAPRVLLIGAGPEAAPLLRCARTLGWSVCVADHREALLEPERLGVADRVVAGRPRAALDSLGDECLDAVLVMTHTAGADLEALRALSTHATPYVGLLGPAVRRDELLSQLEPPERAALEPRLHAPVGLRLGGEGPEAIALAIAADLQRALHAR